MIALSCLNFLLFIEDSVLSQEFHLYDAKAHETALRLSDTKSLHLKQWLGVSQRLRKAGFIAGFIDCQP